MAISRTVTWNTKIYCACESLIQFHPTLTYQSHLNFEVQRNFNIHTTKRRAKVNTEQSCSYVGTLENKYRLENGVNKVLHIKSITKRHK